MKKHGACIHDIVSLVINLELFSPVACKKINLFDYCFNSPSSLSLSCSLPLTPNLPAFPLPLLICPFPLTPAHHRSIPLTLNPPRFIPLTSNLSPSLNHFVQIPDLSAEILSACFKSILIIE